MKLSVICHQRMSAAPRRPTVLAHRTNPQLLAVLVAALLPLAASATSNPPGRYNPVAAPQAVVTLGHARFTVLTSQLLRLEWSADAHFEDRPSLVFLNRDLPVPAFHHKLQREGSIEVLHVDTPDLHLTYRPSLEPGGRFTANDLQIEFSLNGRTVRWNPGMPNPGNLLGTTRTLDRALGDKTIEPIGQGLISRDGWTLVDDSARPLFDSADFSFTQGEASTWPWVIERPAGERQDWYFFGYGHGYKQALGDYIRVAGCIPLPPYFAFGSWWSRYWAYSDQQLDRVVDGFHQNNVPLDVLVIDMDWHPTNRQDTLQGKKDPSGQRLGWTGFSWNKLLFPDPSAFLSNLHRQGLKVTLNLHPASGIQPWETHYPEMARAMGIDPATGQYVPFQIMNKKFAENYMAIIHHPLEKEGVDFWWLDWQQGSATQVPGLNPTWWLNYVYFTDQAREGKRPLLFGRWGGLGNHRYQIGFSGDVISSWDSLAFQRWFTATSANVAYAYWSHDIGGHIPGPVSPELYTRWVQFGVFSPILRTHTSTNPEAERRIWAYPEPYSSTMRAAFELRYHLVPYIYTEARHTYDTGVAFVRPLYYDWPEQDEAYTSKNEYMFGNQILAAPIASPVDSTTGLASESIWLPPGAWIETDTGRRLNGPRRFDRTASIEQIPLYVRPGTILPMAPPMQNTSLTPVDPLLLTVYPLDPGDQSDYTLYQDSHIARGYQQGQSAWTLIHAAQHAAGLTITIGPERGSYPGISTHRAYTLRLPADWPPESVTVDGHALPYNAQASDSKPGWRFEGDTLTTVICIPRRPVSVATVVHVLRSDALMHRRDQLQSFAGSLSRLAEVIIALQSDMPVTFPPDSLIQVAQTGDRLTYHPETASQELATFHDRLQTAFQLVEAMGADGAAPRGLDPQTVRQKNDPLFTDIIKKRTEDFAHAVTRAAALFTDALDQSAQP